MFFLQKVNSRCQRYPFYLKEIFMNARDSNTNALFSSFGITHADRADAIVIESKLAKEHCNLMQHRYFKHIKLRLYHVVVTKAETYHKRTVKITILFGCQPYSRQVTLARVECDRAAMPYAHGTTARVGVGRTLQHPRNTVSLHMAKPMNHSRIHG